VRQRSTGRLSALINTGHTGRFRIDLAPGAYVLAPQASSFLSGPLVLLRVHRHQFAHVVIRLLGSPPASSIAR
jgi:hypothetical protein